MKQLLHQLGARLRRAASRLDAASSASATWFVNATATMSTAAVGTKPGFVAIPTATDF